MSQRSGKEDSGSLCLINFPEKWITSDVEPTQADTSSDGRKIATVVVDGSTG